MAKVKITGHASGTGILTVTAPNTSTDRTITLPDATATLATNENFASTGVDDNATAVKLTVSDSGININGDITFSSASQGICLGVTSNTDSNTLDDYEEGEVTNALDINGTTQTSYSSGRGNLQYTRVGRIVHIQAYLDTQGATLATTGALHIRLPFAVSAGSGTAFITGAAAYVQNVNGVAYPCNAYLNEGDSTISGNYLSSDGNASSITGGSTIEVSNTGHRIIQQYSFSYQTD